jgi:hypothetical protein
MNILYSHLFHLQLAHDYYRGSLAQGVDIFPSPETARLMKNGRILLRNIPSGVVALYRTEDDETTPEIPLGGDVRFSFFIGLENPLNFLNITDLDISPENRFQAGKIPYFTNDPSNPSDDNLNPETLSYSFLDGFVDKLFNYRLQHEDDSVTLRIFNPSGNQVSHGKDAEGIEYPLDYIIHKNEDTGDFRLQIDLRGKPSGKYRILIRNVGETEDIEEKNLWIDSQPKGKNVFGIIELIYPESSNILYGTKEYFSLSFRRKNTVWQYFVVNKNGRIDLEAFDLNISDLGNQPDTPYGTYVFQRVGDEPHESIRINDMDTVIFRSQTPIPYFEEPKLNLQLVRLPDSDPVIIHLPNPSHSGLVKEIEGQLASEIYVFI